MNIHLQALFFLVTANHCRALPQYAERIPNGYAVPNPGPEGGVWAGVGHETAAGGGDRNPFGQDFANYGHEWTLDLCQTDSDGDGKTNGEELGDPECLWYEGGPDPEFVPAPSHPGIYEDHDELINEQQQSSYSLSNCEDYAAPDDEIFMDIAFSAPTQMDETQTHYMCEQTTIDVPAKDVLHQIKTGILLDNSDVLHHMFVYICPPGVDSTDGNRVGEGPYECSGNESGCARIGGWAIGPHENCYPPNVGKEHDFSDTDQLVVKVEAHYDNTLGQPQQDQSGIRLYMTPTLRPLTSDTLIVGMANIDSNFLIPSQQPTYPLTNICPTAITEKLSHPVYAFSFTPHMHLYGRKLVTEHYRCGKKIGEIGRIDTYEFDNQQTYHLNPPVKILPGDAFVTTCQYDTSQVTFDVQGGDETTDEMCLNFLSVYPNPGTEDNPDLFNACMSFENGVSFEGRELNRRFAIGDRSQQTFAIDFESDPEASFAKCCAMNSCEESYLAEFEEACSVDTDCVNNLECTEGLCKMPDEASSPASSPAPFPQTSAAATMHGALVAFLVFFTTIFPF